MHIIELQMGQKRRSQNVRGLDLIFEFLAKTPHLRDSGHEHDIQDSRLLV